MLEAGLAAKQRGVDVVVGLVHSSGRSAIERLVCGFKCLPPVRGSCGAKHPARVDVDAARKREPAILLVDTHEPHAETHYGAYSVHNSESWADIERLLESSISVWAAVDATGFGSWSSVVVSGRSRVGALSLL
jgi:two-component system sensor histidine kinase KdpD